MLRNVFRRYRYLLFLAGCVYFVTSFWILNTLEKGQQGIQSGTIQFFTRINDPFNSRLKHRESAPKVDVNDAINTFQIGSTVRQMKDGNDDYMCSQTIDTELADIQMENVWDRVSVGYPNLVLSVTGWVDTIKVTSWSAKPLHVIVVPHSHQDPGWLETSDSYFRSHTRPTLDILVRRLKANPSLKFIWSEIVFLNWWWKGASSEQRNTLKSLLRNGQLELVSGGWVMPDETVTHYSTLIDQLTEGHQWIKQTFNTTVSTSWAIDPFGHSSTMPYVLRRSGIRNMVIQRTHFAVKRLFAKEKNFEFYWKQPWGDRKNAIFCHMMPFQLYGIPYSCGPDRHVCCKFDFHKKNCFQGTNRVYTLTVTDDNVAILARELWEQLQKKSELYRSDIVLMPHGDDFRYDTEDEWNKQFKNLEKLMKYMNGNQEMNIKIEFGTLADYFKALSADKARSNGSDNMFPTLSGDFQTYSDRGDQYWSGFYTTRPYLKYLTRKLQYKLRQTESMFLFSRKNSIGAASVYDKLERARRSLAVHLHHDAITGTSRKSVIKNYMDKIKTALKETDDIYKASLEEILTKKCSVTKGKDNTNLIELDKIHKKDAEEDHIFIFPNPKSILLISNMLGHQRQDILHVTVNTSKVLVTDSKGMLVRHQIGPVWRNGTAIDTNTYILSFEVNIDPFQITPYFVYQSDKSTEEHVSEIEYYRQSKFYTGVQHKEGVFDMSFSDDRVIRLYNNHLTAVLTSRDGYLKSVYHHDHKRVYKSDTHFVTYSTGRNTHPFSDKSGAYIFLPDGVAKDFKEEPINVFVIKGPLFRQLRAVFNSVTHTVTVFNTNGLLDYGVQIENVADINSEDWNNREFVMRVETDVYNGDHTFCTDVNGFQLQRRKTRSKMTIQGNFYPVTTMALTENDKTRFTMLTTNSHGVASLVSGWLEAVLDRRLVQDDWRGLNEKVNDNLPVKSTFFLMFEDKVGETKEPPSLCLPSSMSDTLSELLNNPLAASLTSSTSECTPYIQFAASLPCGYHILNFRMLQDIPGVKEALVVIHHRGIDCRFPQGQHCSQKTGWSFTDMTSLAIIRVEETSLTGTDVIQTLHPSDNIDIDPMEIKTYKIAFINTFFSL